MNARGTGRSGGTRFFQFDPREQQDVADVIEWAAAQPWCDGKAGMAGMSYFAVIQYLAVAARPAHLTAIFPYLGRTDFYRHAVCHGAALQRPDTFAALAPETALRRDTPRQGHRPRRGHVGDRGSRRIARAAPSDGAGVIGRHHLRG